MPTVNFKGVVVSLPSPEGEKKRIFKTKQYKTVTGDTFSRKSLLLIQKKSFKWQGKFKLVKTEESQIELVQKAKSCSFQGMN